MRVNQILWLLIFVLFTCNLACKSEVKNTRVEVTSSVTIDQMIGQMIMIGFRGFDITELSKTITDQIASGQVGGIILFDYDVVNKEAVRNIKSPAQVRKLNDDLQNLSPSQLFIAIDQEGGRVNRLKTKYGFPAGVSNKYLGNLDNLDSTRFYAELNAATLSDLGFNVNFAPAVDLEINPENPVIGKIERSYSKDADIVIRHSEVWISAHSARGILSTIKHFPGHGSSHTDSHYGVTDITKYWQKEELRPFEELVGTEHLVAVMTAHVVNQNLDKEFPATLSPTIINEVLRENLNYDGIVFSDDLQMKAVNAMFDFETIIFQAITAGVDILVTGNNLDYDEQFAEKTISTILKMIKDGRISKERIQLSYDRIMQVKNLLEKSDQNNN